MGIRQALRRVKTLIDNSQQFLLSHESMDAGGILLYEALKMLACLY